MDKKGELECKLPKAEGKEPKPVGEQKKDEPGAKLGLRIYLKW
ncbi:hypothetical protein [Bacillus xiapuensis]|uniref:Uncharacterized protein n=1 Tax=Bacillus xiapuensis TaxID=2014075 RepID=A0ABU6N5C9_9BACI|nr:hypothetical protein [Bacillus xiapuensis]